MNNLLLNLVIILFALLTFLIAFFISRSTFKKKYGEVSELELRIIDAKRRLESSKKEVEKEVETLKKEGELKVKEEILEKRKTAEEEIKLMKSDITAKEERLAKKEETLESRILRLEEKEAKIEVQKEDLVSKETYLNELVDKGNQELERISELSKEEAAKVILTKLENELDHDKALLIRDYEHNLDRDKDRISKRIISTAIGKAATDYVVDSTISVIQLPSEEMKGRIIGREGRNIRAIEAATGVDLIIDDTPEAVVLSSFDGVRREVAKIALEKLISDGRIHPTKIEEVVEKAQQEVDESIMEAAEQAILEVGIPALPREVLKVLGKLKFRTSFGQNILQHSIEVAHIAATLAAEIGANIDVAKRAALLHDIGKAFSHEQEGSHAINGGEFLRKFSKETEIVINAVEAHHNEVDQLSIEAVLVQAADSISASRPGARRETLSNYLKRLEQLEEIANSHEGIESSYAIQAGREIRLIVNPEKMDDDKATILSREVAKEIEEKMQYPGQIKVTVIRETRAIEYAK
ncbi:MAG: ribonuclease Y [Leptotrichiaceae bacterium]|nr:ribonuclease Y [Leptotrichiaceae bacterium]MBP7026356.1 ribonuclease Y [Leptotrichiaceae bacterium]MBP8637018.1 ribonuclease Y [Leptotrichiaceae bacterium]MBP9538880.1 ribonuclease Y [Leptotrichiaceae bacterium]MBP9875750.1 ribonuclease Y [Leptotrichiaceae bacterium]